MNITPIINAFIALLATIVTCIVIPKVRELLTEKIGAQWADTLLNWASVAVAAAEQIYSSDQGTVKKAYVLEFLASKGYDVESNEVDNAIECAVLELHKALKSIEE